MLNRRRVASNLLFGVPPRGRAAGETAYHAWLTVDGQPRHGRPGTAGSVPRPPAARRARCRAAVTRPERAPEVVTGFQVPEAGPPGSLHGAVSLSRAPCSRTRPRRAILAVGPVAESRRSPRRSVWRCSFRCWRLAGLDGGGGRRRPHRRRPRSGAAAAVGVSLTPAGRPRRLLCCSPRRGRALSWQAPDAGGGDAARLRGTAGRERLYTATANAGWQFLVPPPPVGSAARVDARRRAGPAAERCRSSGARSTPRFALAQVALARRHLAPPSPPGSCWPAACCWAPPSPVMRRSRALGGAAHGPAVAPCMPAMSRVFSAALKQAKSEDSEGRHVRDFSRGARAPCGRTSSISTRESAAAQAGVSAWARRHAALAGHRLGSQSSKAGTRRGPSCWCWP